MRRARPISVLMFVLLLTALPLACSPGGITGSGPSCNFEPESLGYDWEDQRDFERCSSRFP